MIKRDTVYGKRLSLMMKLILKNKKSGFGLKRTPYIVHRTTKK